MRWEAHVIVWTHALIPACCIRMEGLYDASIGKLATGARVVNAHGGWHDSLAKTWVVRKP